ncbi:cytosolic phospholipase A2 [Pelomyxa schiedti]|nr:cytosolic phospholipase A2 [Pelomyxa schiedti]
MSALLNSRVSEEGVAINARKRVASVALDKFLHRDAPMTAGRTSGPTSSTSSPKPTASCASTTCVTGSGGIHQVEAEPLVIAICGSGGGMRALQSMVGFMDGLSHIGLLDAVTFAVGLSGSTWCLSQWVCDTEGNPFHGGTRENDPWRAGGPPFDSARHTHSELKNMLSQYSPAGAGCLLGSYITRKLSLMAGWERFMSKVVLSGRHLEAARFSQCKNRLADGSFPIPVCTAISENEQDSWDWVDFTPFTVRKGGTAVKATENLSDDTLPHLMAVWGSFFAVDWRGWHSEMPMILQWLHPSVFTIPETGRKRREMFGKTAFEEGIGNLRDAGIDFNVPLPALHGRGVDVVLVMDSSEDAQGTEQLAVAVKAGHISICEEDRHLLSKPFGPQERCRFFRPERTGQPAIAYFLCHTQSSTANLQYEPRHVEGIVQSVFNAVVSESARLRWFITRLEHAKRSVAIPNALNSRQNPLGENVRQTLPIRYSVLYERMSLLDHLDHMENPPPFAELYTSLQMAIANRYGYLGQTFGMDRLWSTILRTGNTRCVVEGDPGSGKSTLVKFLAREQGTAEMKLQFGAIIVVELRELCRIATHLHPGPVNLRDCVEDYLLRVLMLDDIMIKDIFAHSRVILWVFDGFEEVDTEKWESFLSDLVHNKLDWAPCVIVTSRHDRRHQIFTGAAVAVVQQWTSAEINTYITKYSNYVQEFGNSADERQACVNRVCKFISDNPVRSRMAGTPLLCEILCTVYSKLQGDTNPSVTTIFKLLVRYAWDRAKSKLRNTDAAWHQNTKIANRLLRERAYNATISTAADDVTGTFHLDMHKQIESLTSCCGLVKRCSCKDMSINVHGFRFLHKTLEEFFTAWHICSKRNAPNAAALLDGIFSDKMSQKTFKWSPRERNLVLFISGLIHDSVNSPLYRSIKKTFIRSLLTVFNSNYRANKPEIEQDLSRDASYPTRDKWRVQLGLDAVVEAVTLLGDDATNKFLKSIRPVGWQASRVMPNFLALQIAPCICRLLTEPAAQHGNLVMLKFLINYTAGDLEQASVEAHVSGQQRVIDWLAKKKAGGVSIGIPARMGNHKAVCHMLAQVEESTLKKELALEAASEAFKNRQACVLNELCKLYSQNDLIDSIIPHILPFTKETPTAELISQFFSGVTILKVPFRKATKKDSNHTCVTIAYSFPSLTHLTCARCPLIGIVAIAKSCTALADLHCSEMSVNSFCGAASCFKKLRHLEVNHLKGLKSPRLPSPLPLLGCQPCTTLTSLHLGASSTADVSSIAPWCPSLTSLTLSHSLSNEDASALATHCAGLSTLHLKNVSHAGVTAISRHLLSLTHLTLGPLLLPGTAPASDARSRIMATVKDIVARCTRLELHLEGSLASHTIPLAPSSKVTSCTHSSTDKKKS